MRRHHTLDAWTPRVRQPIVPILLAATGVLAMQASLAIAPPRGLGGSWGLLGHAGAGATGAAAGLTIAVTVTEHRVLRAVLIAVLAVGAAAVFGLYNRTSIELAYILAVTWWWLTRAVYTVQLALPHPVEAIGAWIRRATGTGP